MKRQPDLGEGLCQPGRTRWLPADAWVSDDPALTAAAAWVCNRRCPVLAVCRQWATALPAGYSGVIGGTTQAERKRAAS